DGDGFLASLDQGAPGWDDHAGPAVILGAGGAARSIVHALVAKGRPVVVANRSADKANALAVASGAKAIALAHLGDALAEASVFVNATSLGMEGEPPLTVDLSPMQANTTVADIVYVPLETPLLAQAKAQGLRPVDGLGMLLHQATVGFERWFGLLPAVDDTLRQKVAATL
ncbi:MAG: NAD(P)-binding domain-containing protein, partial [Pseudomonadota bacterium]